VLRRIKRHLEECYDCTLTAVHMLENWSESQGSLKSEANAALDLPDLTGWKAYCENCGSFHQARLSMHDASEGKQQVALACVRCAAIVLTLQRAVPV
jgi:hypothetical protein